MDDNDGAGRPRRPDAKRDPENAARWQAAVDELMETRGLSRDDAEAIVTEFWWNAQDEAALSFAKAAMPKEQAQLEQVAWQIADLIALDFGVLSPIAVGRLRDAIREYDARAARAEELQAYRKEHPNGNDRNGGNSAAR